VTCDIGGIRVGFAMCDDGCYPQIHVADRERGVKLMLYSFTVPLTPVHEGRAGVLMLPRMLMQ